MRPDHQDLADGLKLTAVAMLSAVLTATLVIGAGRVMLRQPDVAPVQPTDLVRVSTR